MLWEQIGDTRVYECTSLLARKDHLFLPTAPCLMILTPAVLQFEDDEDSGKLMQETMLLPATRLRPALPQNQTLRGLNLYKVGSVQSFDCSSSVPSIWHTVQTTCQGLL